MRNTGIKHSRFSQAVSYDGQLVSRVANTLKLFVIAGFLAPMAAVNANPHAALGGLLDTVNNVRTGAPVQSGESSSNEACDTTAKACYISDVEPVVQQSCVVCHKEGLTADQQGARLLFTDEAASNHSAMEGRGGRA